MIVEDNRLASGVDIIRLFSFNKTIKDIKKGIFKDRELIVG